MKSVKSFNPCKSVILTIYDIVKAHGGSIEVKTNYPLGGPPSGELKVETKEGEGTTFIIQLPMYQT